MQSLHLTQRPGIAQRSATTPISTSIQRIDKPRIAVCFNKQQQRPKQSRTSSLKCRAAVAVDPQIAFDVATFTVLPLYTLMVLAPKWKVTRRLLSADIFALLSAAIYGGLLALWKIVPQAINTVKLLGLHQGLVLPNLTAFATFFARPEATTLAWIHLLLLDLFQARYVCEQLQRDAI